MGVRWIKGDYHKRLTTNKAESLVEYIDPDIQRKLRQHHVEKLAEIIRQDRFLTGHVVLVHNGKNTYVANGQHTLHAIVRADKPIRCLVEEYEADNENDVAVVFNCFDTDGMSRSMRDSAKAILKAGHFGTLGATDAQYNKFRSGVEWFEKNVEGKMVKSSPRLDRFLKVDQYSDTFKFFCGVDEERDSNAFSRTPVIAAMFVTHRANARAAKDFWTEAVTGCFSVEDKTHAPRKLSRFLQDAHAGRHSQTGVIFKPSPNDIYVACVRCFNAYSEGRKIGALKLSMKGEWPVPMAKRRKSA
jgi:disulfide oxidoreductase YuzD